MTQPEIPFRLTLTDCETTGLDPAEDRIIQIAALTIEWGKQENAPSIVSCFEAKCVAPRGYEGSPFNSYDPEVWAERAVPLDQALGQFFSHLEGSTFGGQNPAFDWAFIDNWRLRYGMQWPELMHHRKFDVSSMAMPLQLQGLIGSVSQSTLAKFFGLGEQPHDAYGDVWQSLEIMRRLVFMANHGMTQPFIWSKAAELDNLPSNPFKKDGKHAAGSIRRIIPNPPETDGVLIIDDPPPRGKA